jgi:photosystem II stability/assembly factor-like uncharacterized protein
MEMELGKVVLDLPPCSGNPRNSEGAFLTRKDGSILFIYSRFAGEGANDDASAGLALIESNDRGETWTKEQVIVKKEEHNAKNIMSVSLLRMADGEIGLFYLIRMQGNSLKLVLRRSTDEGASWGEPEPCIPPEGYFVVNNDRIVRLSDGRLVVPAAYHRNKSPSEQTILYDSRSTAMFFLSDDEGRTWREGKGRCDLPFHRYSSAGLQEPGVIELTNGVLWAWARTDLCYQYEMFSFDRGETWTTPQPSRFTSPCSPMSVKRIPQTGNLLAIWNPVPNYNGRSEFSGTVWHGGRNPLVLAVSKDDGSTWADYRIVESQEDHGYCYTAIHFLEDSVLLGYCAGGPEDKSCLAKLRIRRIPLDAISNDTGC